jgi:hypothetical protein
MLAKDQLKVVAQEIDRAADGWLHDCGDEFDRQQLWEVVRRASRVIEAVAELDRDELTPKERSQRARYLESELEIALEAARRPGSSSNGNGTERRFPNV